VASTLLTSLLGLGFWAVAAHIYSVGTLGRDSALVSSMMTISMVCQLNLNNVILRFLPQVRDRIGRRVLSAYCLSGGLSLIAGLGFVLLAPHLNSKLAFLDSNALIAVIFVTSVAIWSIFTLEEAVLASLGFATWLPIENGIFSAAKIMLLPLALLFAGGYGIFVSWVLPMFLSVPVINALIARRVVPHANRAQQDAQGVLGVFGRRRLLSFLLQDFFGTAAGQVAIAAAPLIVVAQLGTADNGYFYIPFTIATTFDRLSIAVAMSLTTEVARTPSRAAELIHKAVTRFGLIEVPIVLLVIAAAPLLLLPFGHGYSQHGSTLLRLMIAASCFRSVTFLYFAIARLRGRGRGLIIPQMSIAAVLISSIALLGSSWGLTGVGVAWLATFVAAAALLTPGLASFWRDPRIPEDEARRSASGDVRVKSLQVADTAALADQH